MYRGLLKVGLLAIPVLLLLGLLVMGLTRWRETANRARCQDNLRRLGFFAMWDYTDREFAFPNGPNPADRTALLRDGQPDAARPFPPGTLANPALPPERRLSWQVILLPHLGRDEVYGRFDLTKAWDDDANRAAVSTLVPTLACPSLYQPAAEGAAVTTPYIGIAGLGSDASKLPSSDPRSGFFRYDEPTKTGMVRRGFSYMLTILETTRDPGSWAAGGPPTVRGLDSGDLPYIGPGRQFGAHPAGCNGAFADGSVRFQSNSIAPRVLEMMATLAAQE